MNTFHRLAASALIMLLLAAGAFAQAPVTALANITEGEVLYGNSSGGWNGYSVLSLIPGAGMFSVKAKTTSLSIGFTGGSTADIGNMVLYKTARSGNTILTASKVKLGGVSNPSINLTSTSTCPQQPVSLSNPCIVKLDPVKALSPLNDYYLVIFFTNDGNNQQIAGTGPTIDQGALSGWYMQGDESRIKPKGTLPGGNFGGSPFFLMYVTNQ